MSDGHSRMYPTDQVNGRCALPHCELGVALRRRVSGSAGADERQGGPRHAWWDKPACGGSTTRRAGQVHAHVAHPPRAVPVQAPIALRLTPSAVHIVTVPGLLYALLSRCGYRTVYPAVCTGGAWRSRISSLCSCIFRAIAIVATSMKK